MPLVPLVVFDLREFVVLDELLDQKIGPVGIDVIAVEATAERCQPCR